MADCLWLVQVYVPSMWHHAVLNLNDTVAVTQNYCSARVQRTFPQKKLRFTLISQAFLRRF